MMWVSVGILLLFIPDIRATTSCEVTMKSLSFTDCSSKFWPGVTFDFGEGNDDVSLPMSSVCTADQNGIQFSVNLNDLTSLKSGHFSLIQNVNSTPTQTFEEQWFIENIEINCMDDTAASFGIARPIIAGMKYSFRNYDTTIGAMAEDMDQREKEIGVNKAKYHQFRSVPSGPLQLRSMTGEELAEEERRQQIVLPTILNLVRIRETLLPGFFAAPQFSNFTEMETFLDNEGLPEKQFTNFWDTDDWFAAQRLQGMDPTIIKLLEVIPDRLDESRCNTIMGESLESVINGKRLFVNDLKFVEDIEGFSAPYAWFYLDTKDNLKPLAILLSRENSSFPVYYPDDEANAWLFAKIFYNGMEAAYQAVGNHLSRHHFIIDQIGVATYNYLSPQHPVFKLIKQHMATIFSQNTRAITTLLLPNAVSELIITGGRKAVIGLINKTLHNMNYRILHPQLDNFDRQTGYQNLKMYPYRDRALPIFNAIKSYVRGILKNYYSRSRYVKRDLELREWRKRLSLSHEKNGVGIKKLPGNDDSGKMNLRELTDIVSTIIFLATVGHASVNNQIFQSQVISPNYALLIKNPPPLNKNGITEDFIFSYLPNKVEQFTIIGLVSQLAVDGGGNYIGDFERQLLQSPADRSVIKNFQDRIEELRTRSFATLQFPYTAIDIENIRNSIRS